MAEIIITEWITDIKNISNDDEAYKFKKRWQKEIKAALEKIKEDDSLIVEELVLTCIEQGNRRVMELVEKLLDKRKLVDWKKHPEIIEHWLIKLEQCGSIPESVNTDMYSDGDYHYTIEKIVGIIKNNKMMKTYEDIFIKLVGSSIATERNRLQIPIVNITTTLEWDKHPEWIVDMMEKTYDILQMYPIISADHHLARTVSTIWMMILIKLRIPPGKDSSRYTGHVSKVFLFCKDQEWVDAVSAVKYTLSYELVKHIMDHFLQANNSNVEILRPMIAAVKELWECDDNEIQQLANSIITSVNANGLDLLGEDTTDTMLEKYFSGEQPGLIGQFQKMYSKQPDKFNTRVDDFITVMRVGPEYGYASTLNLLWEIAKVNPSTFSKDAITAVVNALSIETACLIVLLVLGSLAEKRATEVAEHEEAIIHAMKTNLNTAAYGGTILVKLASLSEGHAKRYLAVLKELVDMSESSMAIGLLHNMKTIGSQNVAILAVYEEFFLSLKNNIALSEHVQGSLDLIAGRTLEGISQDVLEQREDIDNIENRVTNTEENVTNLGTELEITKDDVTNVKQEVTNQADRLAEVENTVEETVEKVEEIDGKTLSHAPAWASDVSKLLNPKSDYDWRFLAGRLSYNNDDIRNWATQSNPCLSMMDEWFATHKTREATFAILAALQEMNRTDAALIVENALKQVEDIVVDEDLDYESPPSVFISYQWGLQAEVKLLHKHLQMAGYESWMDIGQMGGGDKLFEKIDRGIRAAKVILCCVSSKYAQSPNCNREVNLSVTLGKPIIPLLMEKLQWPPPGSMGPIFGEYLFIRFFSRPGELADDGRYWPVAKYQELLMQLRYYVAPEKALVTDLYKDWWNPPEEIVVIEPKATGSGQQQTVDHNNDCLVPKKSNAPEIFISYQWGKQTQIKALYTVLVSLGYNCWLDIMQMGGGDSLYDKIDKGVRGSEVVLSCVTAKYSISANCRREVSLADALKKPIIPLLLDPTVTWPPEGPMSMVFTQLLYINFCKPNCEIQNHWNCPQMKELHSKIKEIIPSSNDIKCTGLPDGQIPTVTDSRQFDLNAGDNPKVEDPAILPTVKENSNSKSCVLL